MFHRLIRLPLRCIPKSLTVPILSGPARGLRWITGAGTHGCWLGTYERDRQNRLLEVLKPGGCFLDIGANVGFYSLLGSRIVGPKGQVHAFEPLPRNVDYLNKHVRMNAPGNVTVHALALSDGADRTMKFATSINPCSGFLSNGESTNSTIDVPVTSLDSLWQKNTFPNPTVLKIDVEGAEFNVLTGGAALIATCRPVILLAGHGTAVQNRCIALLESWDYRIAIDRDGSADGMYESTALSTR